MGKLIHVVGARPNFMKVAPVMRALARWPSVHQLLVHTGQHYDQNMSEIFFHQLLIPEPDINLEVGSGSHAQQTAEIMIRLEDVAIKEKPDWVTVYGDVNSTVAAALVCAKLLVPVAHVEAGLRSGDRRMPEEINRLLTDQLADLLFTPSSDGNANLRQEGISEHKIHLVGNVMIDTLVDLLPQARMPFVPNLSDRFILVTLHRPSNVDDPIMLRRIIEALRDLSECVQVLFPMHPRTRQQLVQNGLMNHSHKRFLILEPMGYLEFLALQRCATIVITDSGGIQEESTYLGVPCLTVRENTERPITITEGTNILVGRDLERLRSEACAILEGRRKKGRVPELWDGKASERIADIFSRVIS